MKYIVSKNFNQLALCNEVLDLPVGTEVTLGPDDIVFYGDKMICRADSYNGQQHFAMNEDGNGIRRGKITYAIAYGERNNGQPFRFTDEEQNLLKTKWSRFLRPNSDALLFNSDFFRMEMNELEQILSDLNMTVN